MEKELRAQIGYGLDYWPAAILQQLIDNAPSVCEASLPVTLNSKSYWHLPKTLATQTGMTTEWLKRQGLIGVRELWMTAHGYA